MGVSASFSSVSEADVCEWVLFSQLDEISIPEPSQVDAIAKIIRRWADVHECCLREGKCRQAHDEMPLLLKKHDRNNAEAAILEVADSQHCRLVLDKLRIVRDWGVLLHLFLCTQGDTSWKMNEGWKSMDMRQWWGVTVGPRAAYDSDVDSGSILLHGVREIKLCGNGLRGPLPSCLGMLSHLERLSLQCNAICGCIPESLCGLSSLRVLNLSWAHLQGPIPSAIGGLSATLRELHLQHNKLEGAIPPQMGQLVKLYILNLSHNCLSGPLPPELSALTNLALLGLASNNLSGDLPPPIRGCVYTTSGNTKLAEATVTPKRAPAAAISNLVYLYPMYLCPTEYVLSMRTLLPHELIRANLVQLTCEGPAAARSGVPCSSHAGISAGVSANVSATSCSAIFVERGPSRRSSAVTAAAAAFLAGPPSSSSSIAFITHHSSSCQDHAFTLAHLQRYLRETPNVTHIWMDLLCSPSHSSAADVASVSERARAMENVPLYMQRSGHFTVLTECLEDFTLLQGRAWYRLEQLLAAAVPVLAGADGTVTQERRQVVSIMSASSGADRTEMELSTLAGEGLPSPLEGQLSHESDRMTIAAAYQEVLTYLESQGLIDAATAEQLATATAPPKSSSLPPS